jgi:hypothetical protein
LIRCHFVFVSNLLLRQFEGVPKPVIGRKLGWLMGKRPGARAASRLPSPDDPPSGPGMRSLFRGHPPSSRPRRWRIPRWYLFGADLLLVAAALMVMSRSPAPLTGNEKFFGVAAVVLGASLGLIAICMKDHKEK